MEKICKYMRLTEKKVNELMEKSSLSIMKIVCKGKN